ncbi:tripartite tricarboxylate transporter TctB family protein [Micromonospora sp. NPDC007230]|uniref:tripartite tricarboxylate transporter TctB family protein n=1 Tax=Micromonospora sp. NPDC007230 TaxID=3364237 RepID=UPI0036CD062E
MIGSVKDKGELGFAGCLLALGLFVLVDTATIAVPRAASNVGPRFVPYAVGALLTASAAFVVIDLLRGNAGTPEESEFVDPSLPMNRRRVALLIASVVVFAVLLEPAGYVIASSVTFFGVATTLGARRYGRVAVGAVLLSAVIHVVFTGPLGIYLPGLLEGVR